MRTCWRRWTRRAPTSTSTCFTTRTRAPVWPQSMCTRACARTARPRMFTLIESGEVYAPEPLGIRSVLLVGDRIATIGHVDGAALQSLGLSYTIVDAKDCYVLPGLV